MPEGKTLVVRDQTSEETVYINIPAENAMEDVELNEEQLEAVAGGRNLPYFDKPFGDITISLPPGGGQTGPIIDTSTLGQNSTK